VFLGPTIEQLAAAIDGRLAGAPARPAAGGSQDVEGAAGPLVPIEPAGSGPPFFCVHAVGGSAVPYVPLARLLSGERPFYGLEALGLRGEPPMELLPAMAERYLAALRSVQPTGPYHLGGWSIGGAIAFEMACQLRDRGEQVASLLMLDTAVPPGLEEVPDRAALLTDFAADLAGLQAKRPAPLDRRELAGLPHEEQVSVVIRTAEEAGLIPLDVRAEIHTRIRLFIANATAALRYRPRRFDGPVTVLRAAEASEDQTLGWDGLAARVVRQVVPGTHYSMLQPPHVAALAAALRRCLDEAGSRPGTTGAPATGPTTRSR
jgi:thioesterase domain-containing protein